MRGPKNDEKKLPRTQERLLACSETVARLDLGTGTRIQGPRRDITMQDTGECETRIRELVLDMAAEYDTNLTIKFGRSKRNSGRWLWYSSSGVHVLTFSRAWLRKWHEGFSYGTYARMEHVWAPYGKLYGTAAEWAIVVHEFAHILQWEREGEGNGDDHNGCFTRCVRELQQRFPLEQHGGTQPMFPPLDFEAMKPVVFVDAAPTYKQALRAAFNQEKE